MWLLSIFFLVSVEFIFQISKFSYFDTIPAWILIKVFFNSIFLLALPGIVIIGFFYLITFVYKNVKLLSRMITNILLFALSFALVFVFFLHLTTWLYTTYKVNIHELQITFRYIIWIIIVFLGYFIYRYRSYPIYSFFSQRYRYILSVLSLCAFIGLTNIVFEYPKYVHTPQISQIKKEKNLPNIILFSSDGLNPEHMGVYGYERDTTPNLSELAKSSSIFFRAYGNATTSRGGATSILTGKYPVTTKVLQQMNILQGMDSFQHLPGILKSLGYYNIDTGPVTQTIPTAINLRNGFDEVNSRQIPLIFGQLSSTNTLIKIFNVEMYFLYNIANRFLERIGKHTVTGLSDLKMIKTVEKALKEVDAPIFAHLHLLETHPHPRTKTYDPFLKKFSKGKQPIPIDRDLYDDAIYSMDFYFGELIRALKENNEFDNTLIVFFTDHGMELVSGHIVTVLPLIVKFPGKNQPESCYSPVQYLDIAPSILKWLNMPIPEWMEGQPFLVNCNDVKPERYNNRPIYTFTERPKHTGIELANIIVDNYYLTFHLPPPTALHLYDTRKSPYVFIQIHDNNLSRKYLKLLMSFLSKKGIKLPKSGEKLKVVMQDYLGFKIIHDKDCQSYYGLQNPQAKTILGKVHFRDHRRRFVNNSIAGIKSAIERYWHRLEKRRQKITKIAKKEDICRPRLIEGYSGFNIVNYKGIFYGVNRLEGPLDIRNIRTKAKYPWVSGESGMEVKSKIDELLTPLSSVISADSSNDPEFDAANIFVKNASSFWETSNPFPHWIQFDFGKNPVKITKYTLQSGTHGIDASERMPKDWRFQGSNERSRWTTLDTRKKEINWKNNEKRTYRFAGNSSYRYYRLYITAGINPDILRLYEIELAE